MYGEAPPLTDTEATPSEAPQAAGELLVVRTKILESVMVTVSAAGGHMEVSFNVTI